jgi:hypothetical protein
MQWVRYNTGRYPCLELFHHVYNEGKRAPWKAKELGILSGLPDYHLPVEIGLACGFWLEIKDTGKKPTKKQLKIMRLLEDFGNRVCWTDNLDKAIEHVETYCKWVHR